MPFPVASRASSALSVATWQALSALNSLLRGAGLQLFEQGGQRAVLVDDRVHVRGLLRERDVLLLQGFDLLPRRLAAAPLPRGSQLLARLVALRGQLLHEPEQLLDGVLLVALLERSSVRTEERVACAPNSQPRAQAGPRGVLAAQAKAHEAGDQSGGQQWRERQSPPRHVRRRQ